MRVLFINNKDSFVWNLVDYVSIFEPDTVVVPNTVSSEEVRKIKPDAIVISPGPGTAHKAGDVGNCLGIIRDLGPHIPVLGVCFGHQAINAAFGGSVGHAKGGPIHGKTSDISHDGSRLFAGIPLTFKGGRYHSLAIEKLADELEVTARTPDGIIMAVEHTKYPIYGVQFHPESVLTESGMKIVENFLIIAGMHKD
ncbi:glutamine amidotransferase of anthranilate synthase or aminodeoxychorismate synthase [Methanomethylovorans hollandica DSM 15978]|uniref:anthranilate synthase n=1 Tax=Methanomethylovorans hollandica (strain DSM 15978 / NBRC 107637 / DMS1) TaxID=867904 RepID=L0L098_METHD|nr:aminodeoxychorismate/anthranilate synthase component II [Methanomethylovorans hollandica]AGB50345.1 glutamine amidotransferase of anthranilate synthase or aminodeoxychorismate synthase [Methanomethylovorans hollandica DSM 15978]